MFNKIGFVFLLSISNGASFDTRKPNGVAFLTDGSRPTVVSTLARRPSRFVRFSTVDSETDSVQGTFQPLSGSGLYKRFADYSWTKLKESNLGLQDVTLPQELCWNQAPAKGTTDSIVQISTRAMTPSFSGDKSSVVRYARVALLETISPSNESDDDNSIHTSGIQVLNLVVIPSDTTSLPVLGIDLVSLPGNRHLLLLDAQPMIQPNPYEDNWAEWYSTRIANNPDFPWGGDFPEPVQQYVSKYALWSRLQDSEDPVSVIQTQVWDAFVGHLDVYLELLTNCDLKESEGKNHQPEYLDYRRGNDPAKPMLNSLFGPEWTNQLLDEVLFPND